MAFRTGRVVTAATDRSRLRRLESRDAENIEISKESKIKTRVKRMMKENKECNLQESRESEADGEGGPFVATTTRAHGHART